MEKSRLMETLVSLNARVKTVLTAHQPSKSQQIAVTRCARLVLGRPGVKEVSKFNATKHGLRASEIVLPGQEDTLDKVFGEKADNPAPMLRVWFLDEMSGLASGVD